jgi:hypothetical protein
MPFVAIPEGTPDTFNQPVDVEGPLEMWTGPPCPPKPFAPDFPTLELAPPVPKEPPDPPTPALPPPAWNPP